MVNEIPSSRKCLPEGTLLNGRYEIKSTIGGGGFSNTYLAVHRDMKNEVAIKEFYCRDYMYRDCRISNEILIYEPGDENQRKRDLENFVNEARILAELKGINGIIHVTDYFSENATAYIVMDFVKGVSLEQQLSSGMRYRWDDILKKMIPVMDALYKVHKKELIHRDIKPDNIIITEDGSLKLIDFGSALHNTREETHSVYLTEGYAPKEQYLRSGRLGAYTDIYALCAVIYRCLTGYIPENALQRSVFDELKSPSELGIHLPTKFEQALMKGLQIESEDRWQSMDELLAIFTDCLPKQPMGIKPIYLIAGVLAVALVLGTILFNRYYMEIKMQQLASRGELVEFDLTPPESMAAQEFSQAVDIIKKRAGVFAENDGFLMETYPDRIHLRIPSEKYTAVEPDEKGAPEWSIEEQLKVLFCFSGKWRLHTADMTHLWDVAPDHFKSVELKYDNIPIKTTSGDILYNGKEIDWSQQEYYYLEVALDDKTADFLSPEINEEGFLWTPVPHVEDGMYIRPWISKGDGKTIYYPIGSSNCKNIAETMLQILTHEPLSDALTLTWEDKSGTASESVSAQALTPSEVSTVSDTELSMGTTVEVSAEAFTAEDKTAAIEFCKKQLDMLEIPYYMWEEGLITHLQVPTDKINSLILYSLFYNSVKITTLWNEYLLGSDEFIDITYEEHEGKAYLSIYISKDALERRYVDRLEPYRDNETEEPLYLTMGDTRIGIIDSFDWEKGYFNFEIYLPKEGEDPIQRDRMLQYFCHYIMEGSQVKTYYTNMSEWKDSEGNSLTGSSIPKLSPGLSLDRFSSLFSSIEELGGQAVFSIDDLLNENIKISFDHWNGNFPEEALKMVEDIYSENGLGQNICLTTDFEVKTYAKGSPANLKVYFSSNDCLQSFICRAGHVDASEESIVERAKTYVEKSSILFTPETETDRWKVYASDWTYLTINNIP